MSDGWAFNLGSWGRLRTLRMDVAVGLIALAAHGEPMCLGDFRGALAVPQAVASDLIARLKSMGLVGPAVVLRDRRRNYYALTAKGWQWVKRSNLGKRAREEVSGGG